MANGNAEPYNLSKNTIKNIKNHKNLKKSLPEGKPQCRTLQFIKKNH